MMWHNISDVRVPTKHSKGVKSLLRGKLQQQKVLLLTIFADDVGLAQGLDRGEAHRTETQMQMHGGRSTKHSGKLEKTNEKGFGKQFVFRHVKALCYR